MSIKKKIGGALLGTALGAALIGGGTFAIFTDSDTNTGNSFAAGTLDINLDKEDGVAKYFDVSTMAPGDKGSAPVKVSNDGSLELRYDFSTALSGDLAAAGGLTVSVYTDAALTTPATLTDRPLAPNTSETLYVKYELPSSAGNSFQNDRATLAITADAEQTRNNPVQP